MNMTAHDDIIDFALSLLRLPAPVTDGLIEEELDLADVPEDFAEAISVDLLSSEPNDARVNGADPLDWDTRLVVTCGAADDSRRTGAHAGRASRILHNLVHQRLMADASWGGRLMYIGPPTLSFEGRSAASRMGSTTAIYRLVHRTPYNTLEA